LGISLADRGDESAAAEAFRPAAERGNADAAFHLGVSLAATGHEDEAVEWHQRAAAGGVVSAHINLGALLLARGDQRGAESHYRSAAEAGEPLGAANLVRLLLRQGRAAEAWSWLAAFDGAPDVAVYAGESAVELGERALGKEILLQGMTTGSVHAAAALGLVLLEEKRIEEARSLLQAAAAAGSARALGGLSALALQDGDRATADRLVEQLAGTDRTELVTSYAEYLSAIGEPEAAERFLRLVADREPRAAVELGRLLLVRRADDEAAAWLDGPAAADFPDAGLLLGILEDQRGNTAAAERAFRRAADAGDGRAAHKLAMLRERVDDKAGAISWYERAAAAGERSAMFNLGLLFDQAQDTAVAETWFRRAHEAGHERAAFSRGLLAFRGNRFDEAVRWWEEAAAGGDQRAVQNLAALRQRKRHRWWSR
jgi:TPR repeat protein